MQEHTVEIEEEVHSNGNDPSSGMPSALDALLSWDGSLRVIKKIHMERLNIDVIIRAATMEEMEKFSTASETIIRGRRGSSSEKETDNVKLGRLLVFNCVEVPDLSNDRLQEKHNTRDGKIRVGHLIVNSLFLPGEIMMLQNEIMDLSGFSEGAYMAEGEDENLS